MLSHTYIEKFGVKDRVSKKFKIIHVSDEGVSMCDRALWGKSGPEKNV